jgi:hypothetical protein
MASGVLIVCGLTAGWLRIRHEPTADWLRIRYEPTISV